VQAYKYFTFMPLEGRGDRWKEHDDEIGSKESIWDIDAPAIQMTYMYLYENDPTDDKVKKCINPNGELYELDTEKLPQEWKNKLDLNAKN